MIRGTTPTFEVIVEGANLTDKTAFLTLSQGDRKITLTNDRLRIVPGDPDSTIAFTLTQCETLCMKKGGVSIQLRFIDDGGVAWASNIVSVSIDPVLLERVIDYAD